MMRNNTLFVLFLGACGLFLFACKGKVETPAAPATMLTNTEQHRPQFHFSPAAHWMNDPNGMVFYEGEYHLFYQYYPDSSVWGPMHWGHAVSTDLAHWEHLPIALYPDSLGFIFSGSAVIDWNNTTGFGKDGKPPMVAMFTLHNMPKEKAGQKDCETQGIAYSNDRGRTWTKFSGNPVISNPEKDRDFRDPKVIWVENSKQWVVTLAVGDHTEFWGSPDLKKWEHLSDFGKEYGVHAGVWECPDLFPIKVEGTGEQRWVLFVNINPGGPNGGSATQYFIGNFDGKTFTLDPDVAPAVAKGHALWLDEGKDNYASVSWSDVPKSDGRRLFIGWMSNWEYANKVPTTVWRNAATLPRSLTLNKTEAGYRLFALPVKELEALRGKSYEIPKTEISGLLDLSKNLGFSPAQSEMTLEFDLTNAAGTNLGVELSNAKGETYRIGYDAVKNQFYSDRTKAGDHAFSPEKFATGLHTAPRVSKDKTLRLHLFFDVASVELFADNGATVMTELYFPSEDFNQVKLVAEGGKAPLTKGTAYQIQRIWK
ncbi:MAG: glycoside hydrolase family 32 protein [Bacteroidota bacterium]